MSIDLEAIRAARSRIGSGIHRTPLLSSATLSEMSGAQVWLKAESLQKTGSFKVRGALNAVGALTEEERRRGVITVSAGNHGMALAYAARQYRAPAVVVMPMTAVTAKIAAIQGYGGRAELVDGSRMMESMEAIRAKEGYTFIHPFDHPDVVAGQGTVGLEIVEDLPDVDAVIVPVGGGGLLSGVAIAVKTLVPGARVVGVEPEGSTAVSQSLDAGRPLRLETFHTVADGLNAPWSGPITLEIIQRLVDMVTTVSDEQIIEALVLALERTKLVLEPAGAAGIAALLAGCVDDLHGRNVVIILSGGNVGREPLAQFLAARKG